MNLLYEIAYSELIWTHSSHCSVLPCSGILHSIVYSWPFHPIVSGMWSLGSGESESGTRCAVQLQYIQKKQNSKVKISKKSKDRMKYSGQVRCSSSEILEWRLKTVVCDTV